MNSILKIKLLTAIILFSAASNSNYSYCAITDSNSFYITSRLSFYSYEKEGEFLLHIPSSVSGSNLTVTVRTGEDTLVFREMKAGDDIHRLTFAIDLDPSVYPVTASIVSRSRPDIRYTASTELMVLNYKSNEVKTDRFTGGLVVNRRPFFPFGFYCYSPVDSTLPEVEVIKGFNMISPYQKIIPETLSERKSYMDRCAQLGMKVHYNLLSVSGGGGVGSTIEGLSDEEKQARLITEIELFRDHPALLGWYVADEPNGYRIPPEVMENIYTTVREIDPWHPVSIVFMAPFLDARKYINALDIVMADPYPIPDLPVTMVGNITSQLVREFNGKKPVWIVPQAFGGGELWKREPSAGEIRSMTWQSIIRGATGIQYFVRQGPNYFPKSVASWNECGKIAMEVAELTPWLLSDDNTFRVESDSRNILVTSRYHNDKLIVIAVNTSNRPLNTAIRIYNLNSGNARLLFENRSVRVNNGILKDIIAPLGSQVYLIDRRNGETSDNENRNNLIVNPGFEDFINPGIPSSCYARPGGDKGATFFLDTREYYQGNHSVRIITPQQDKGISLRLYPITVQSGRRYVISIWAKSDPEQRFYLPTENTVDNIAGQSPQYVEILMGDFVRSRFVPDNEWRQYMTFIEIPENSSKSFKTNLILKMPGQGVAWFDQIKVIPEE